MNDLDTLKTHLDAAWNQLVRSDLYRRAITEATATYRESRESPRIYLRLDELESSIFQLAALMSDDDIAEMLDTIANEKDVKMVEYKLPAEPDGPVWDTDGDKWEKIEKGKWGLVSFCIDRSWERLLLDLGPLTDTPPLPKVGDEIDGEEAGHLPDGSIFAQERGVPFQAISKFRVGNGRDEWTRQAFQEIWKDASFTVLRAGWEWSAE